MENATEALKIAGALLIFVLALSISINAFGQARIASQTILEASDREYNYTYVENNGGTKRIVGLESILPSIYKAYRENYKIVFTNFVDGVYKKKNSDGIEEEINCIDFEKEVLGNETQKLQFITVIIYGQRCSKENVGFDFDDVSKYFEDIYHINLNNVGLYDKIGLSTFEEETGIFYQEEAGRTDDDSESVVPEANMTTKRVITYTQL